MTISKGLRVALRKVTVGLERRRHLAIVKQNRRLASLLRWHLAHRVLPDKSVIIKVFIHPRVTRHRLGPRWRCSQRATVSWERMSRLVKRRLSRPKVSHPYQPLQIDGGRQRRGVSAPVRCARVRAVGRP